MKAYHAVDPIAPRFAIPRWSVEIEPLSEVEVHKMVTMRHIIFFLAVVIAHVNALSCFCGQSPCEVPKCCPSGKLTLDACGCCPVCAKGEKEACGGPFRISGACVSELNCLRKCDCKAYVNATNQETDCVFPFKFKGVEYNECTKDHSDNGKPWCATEVDSEGVAINNQWGDCQFNCPGTEYPCDESALFNFEGVCVKKSETEQMLVGSPLSYSFDENYSTSNEATETCLARDTVSPIECRCAPPRANPDRGEGCQQDFGSEGPSSGWCFLEHVPDPNNPSFNCYPDASWSTSHGRFYSNMACGRSDTFELNEPTLLEPEIPPPPPTFSGAGPPAPPPSGAKLIFPPAPPPPSK